MAHGRIQLRDLSLSVMYYPGIRLLRKPQIANTELFLNPSFQLPSEEAGTFARHLQPTQPWLCTSRWPLLPLDQPPYLASDVICWGSLDRARTSGPNSSISEFKTEVVSLKNEVSCFHSQPTIKTLRLMVGLRHFVFNAKYPAITALYITSKNKMLHN